MPPSANRGWVEYPIPPDDKDRFTEDLDIIVQLVRSICYEYQSYHGKFYIRRVE